jgi:hypothetical protein
MSPAEGVPRGDRVQLREDAVAWRLVGEEVVAIDLDRSTYLGVNRTGSLVWQTLADGATLGDLVTLITDHFDVDRNRAAEDLDDFLTRLERRGLVERVDAP